MSNTQQIYSKSDFDKPLIISSTVSILFSLLTITETDDEGLDDGLIIGIMATSNLTTLVLVKLKNFYIYNFSFIKKLVTQIVFLICWTLLIVIIFYLRSLFFQYKLNSTNTITTGTLITTYSEKLRNDKFIRYSVIGYFVGKNLYTVDVEDPNWIISKRDEFKVRYITGKPRMCEVYFNNRVIKSNIQPFESYSLENYHNPNN